MVSQTSISIDNIAFHHRWDNAAQSIPIPDELARLLDCFLKRGHHVASPGCPFVFSNRHGRGFTDAANLTYYWGRISKKICLPASVPPTRSAANTSYCSRIPSADPALADNLLSTAADARQTNTLFPSCTHCGTIVSMLVPCVLLEYSLQCLTGSMERVRYQRQSR